MIYNERCTIVANQDGSIKTAFVDRMGVDPEGRHYGAGQATIGNDELAQFLGTAHNVALSTIARLEAEAATAATEAATEAATQAATIAELQAINETKSSQLEAYAAIEAEQADNINGLQTNLAELRTDLEVSTDQLNLANNTLATVEALATQLQAELTESQSMHTQASSRLEELQGDYDAMEARLNALLNPAIPVGVPGQIKSVTFSFDETAWPGIVAALSDPANTETPTETQATNAVFAFITQAYKANAAKIALTPIQQRVEAAIEARAESVLSSSSVVIE